MTAYSNLAQRTSPTRESASARWKTSRPSHSVILVSRGTRHELETAVRTLTPSLRAVRAQLVVVRRSAEPSLDILLSDAGRVLIVRAPDDFGRNEMLTMAMRMADGDVVSVRDDSAVEGDEWLAGCRRFMESRSAVSGSDAQSTEEGANERQPTGEIGRTPFSRNDAAAARPLADATREGTLVLPDVHLASAGEVSAGAPRA